MHLCLHQVRIKKEKQTGPTSSLEKHNTTYSSKFPWATSLSSVYPMAPRLKHRWPQLHYSWENKFCPDRWCLLTAETPPDPQFSQEGRELVSVGEGRGEIMEGQYFCSYPLHLVHWYLLPDPSHPESKRPGNWARWIKWSGVANILTLHHGCVPGMHLHHRTLTLSPSKAQGLGSRGGRLHRICTHKPDAII